MKFFLEALELCHITLTLLPWGIIMEASFNLSSGLPERSLSQLSFAIAREWKLRPFRNNFPGAGPKKVIKNKVLCDIEHFADVS